MVTGSLIEDVTEGVGCRVARWKVATVAAADAGCCCCCCLAILIGLPPSKDLLRGLLAAETIADGSCCWLNIHRKYHDIARAYCAGPRTSHSRGTARKKHNFIYFEFTYTQNTKIIEQWQNDGQRTDVGSRDTCRTQWTAVHLTRTDATSTMEQTYRNEMI